MLGETVLYALMQGVILWLFWLTASRLGLGMLACFYGVFVVLIVIPFHLIAAHAAGVIDLAAWFGRPPDAKVTLPLGDGRRALRIVLLEQLLLIGGAAAMRLRSGPPRDARGRTWMFAPGGYAIAGLGCAAAGAIYMAVRMTQVNDFPLLVLLRGGGGAGLRDIAFAYASSRESGLAFHPTVASQFYRVLLPLGGLMLLTAAARRAEQGRAGVSSAVLRGLGLAALGLAFVFVFGTFKRAQPLYLLLWLLFVRHAYAPWGRVRRLAIWACAAVVVLSAITMLYGSHNWSAGFRNLAWRTAVGEAVGEYLALEHFGVSLPHMGWDYPMAYVRKIAGEPVMTFSEYWKQETGGNRGYTSIGVLAEIYVITGPAGALLLWPLFGAALCAVDLHLRRLVRNRDLRPIVAGMLVSVSFMSVKGFFSQLMAGGLITFTGVLVGTVLLAYRPRRSAKAAAAGPSAAVVGGSRPTQAVGGRA